MAAYMQRLKEQYADRTVYSRVIGLAEAATSSWAQGSAPRGDAILSVCMDGMDQNKFRTPRNLSSSKLFEALWRPTCHLTGLIIHGIGEYYYVSDPGIRKDSNANAELLARSLDHAPSALQRKGITEFPPHLVLQTDNTSREQKNTNGLMFLAWLVATCVFQSSQLNTMMVGHTHIDADQRFSSIGAKIKTTTVPEEPSGFQKVIQGQVKGCTGREVIAEVVPGTRN